MALSNAVFEEVLKNHAASKLQASQNALLLQFVGYSNFLHLGQRTEVCAENGSVGVRG